MHLFLLLFFQASERVVSDPSRIVSFFEQGSRQWEALIVKEAGWLFYILAGFDCVWLFISKIGETHDIKDAWNHIMPRMVGLLFWFTILKQGLPFLLSIPLSFMQLGKMASNTNAVTASGILADGFDVATALLHNAYESGGAFDLLTGALFGLAAIFIIIGYAIVCFHFAIATIEMWTSLRAAFLFVGFSGSRWTEPYAERYITLLISTGLRLMILELFVGFGHQFATQWWLPGARTAPYDDVGVMMAFQVAVSAMLFGMICHHVPAKIAGILSGSPALSAGSVSSFVAPLAQSTLAGATMIYSSVTNAVGQGAQSAVSAARSAVSTATGAMGGSEPPNPKPNLASIGGSSMSGSGRTEPPNPKPNKQSFK